MIESNADQLPLDSVGTPGTASPPNPWWNRLSSGAWLGLAWLVFELTAELGVSAAVFCAQFAIKDVLTGGWMLRRDAQRARGRACCAFYLARGVWKMLLADLVVFIVWFTLYGIDFFVQGKFGKAPNYDGLYYMGLAGIVVFCVAFTAAGIIAGTRRIRIWMPETANQSRLADQWPPATTGVNLLAGLVTRSGMVMIMIPMPFLVAEIPIWIGFAVLAVVVGFILWVYYDVTARTPDHCWEMRDHDLHDLPVAEIVSEGTPTHFDAEKSHIAHGDGPSR